MDNFTPLKKNKSKKKLNKYFLIANIFLMLVVVVITGYYLSDKLITKREKAEILVQRCPNGELPVCESPPVTECTKLGQCDPPRKIISFCEPQNQVHLVLCQSNCKCEATPTDTPTPTPTQFIFSSCNSSCSDVNPCFNEEPDPNELVCSDIDSSIGKCRNKSCPDSPNCICPTNTPTPTRTPTPTPTPTDVVNSTPTPTTTPTGTIVPSNTPTSTPTGTIVPSNTPTITSTNTPGPSATLTPTNIPGAPTATPTEIILAQTTVISPPVPVTGMIQSFMYLIPALIIFVGLIL